MDKDLAIRKIQSTVREFLRRQLKKKEKNQLEEAIRRAYVASVQEYREELREEREKEVKKREKKLADQQRKQRFLEAAYDGRVNELKNCLEEFISSSSNCHQTESSDSLLMAKKNLLKISLIECQDVHGHSPLSEAASGGSVGTVEWLLATGAWPNSRGQFHRTPLYRATFAGHLAVCEVLLNSGADPRLCCDDGSRPIDVAPTPAVSSLLSTWNLEITDNLLESLAVRLENFYAEKKLVSWNRVEQVENQLDQLLNRKKQLEDDVEKILGSYPQLRTFFNSSTTFTLPDHPNEIHRIQLDLETLRNQLDQLNDKISSVRMKLRDRRRSANVEVDSPLDEGIPFREIGQMVLEDRTGLIGNAEKWPVLVDRNGKVATFLRYRDTNFVLALNRPDMVKDRLRQSLLGAIRFGKAFVIDMDRFDLYRFIKDRINDIQLDLFDKLISKEILIDENYLSLVSPGDGVEYEKGRFSRFLVDRFKFILVTRSEQLGDEIAADMMTLIIFIMLDQLPIELLCKILGEVNVADVANFALTCRSCYTAYCDEYFWREKCLERSVVRPLKANLIEAGLVGISDGFPFRSTYLSLFPLLERFVDRLSTDTLFGLYQLLGDCYGDLMQLSYSNDRCQPHLIVYRPSSINGSPSFERDPFLPLYKFTVQISSIRMMKECFDDSRKVTDHAFRRFLAKDRGIFDGNWFRQYHTREIRLFSGFAEQQKKYKVVPGLYKGTYGPHGVEIVQLYYCNCFSEEAFTFNENYSPCDGSCCKDKTKTTANRIIVKKISGDPNVPAGQWSIVADLDRNLDLTNVDQTDWDDLGETVESTEISWKPIEQQFRLPFDCYNRFAGSLPAVCFGRMVSHGQVAQAGYIDPAAILGHFICFGDSCFGHLWLPMRCFGIYSRISIDELRYF